MSKRSRDASFSPAADESLAPALEDEQDALAGLAPPTKFSQIDPDGCATVSARVVQCTLAPHSEALCFDTQEEFEIHYAKEHINRCAACSKNFPTPCFLELHIEENHNALRELQAARGEKTYSCFVEDCDRKCSTPQKRRLHLIDKHMFPRTYNFRIVDQGIDKAASMLRGGRRQRVSTAQDNQPTGKHRRQALSTLHIQPAETGEGKSSSKSISDDNEITRAEVEPRNMNASSWPTTPDKSSKDLVADLDSLAQSLSALRFVPTSVRRRQHQKRSPLDNGQLVNEALGDEHE